MNRQHHYKTKITWTGNNGAGTISAKDYERSHLIEIAGKNAIMGSSDAPFRGDVSKHNPEDFLVSALSACHMLWYLHLCADAGVIITAYIDSAQGLMEEKNGGGGNFVEVTLHPQITLKNRSMLERAEKLHEAANSKCFIANSCNFPVKHAATYHFENE